MPQLSRMHQFKTKSNGQAQIPLGIYTYPVLQVADILLFKATHVPVGEDQVQHLEFCRDLCAKFNKHYNTEFFPLPITIECNPPLSQKRGDDNSRKKIFQKNFQIF
jgi:tryptophanyl-tRNA synthetase